VQTVIDGILTNYEILGSKNPESALILHGWGQSSENWKAVADRLSAKYSVILLDLPGFGSSSQSEIAFDIQAYSDFVDKFIDKIALSHLILIGHSFGGKISIKIAAENPKIDSLFLISPSGIENKSIMAIVKTIISKILKVFLFWMPQKFREKYIRILGSRDYVSAGKMRDTFKKIVNEKVISSAKKINVPTIIIWGDKDSELSLKNAKSLKNLIRNSTLRVLWGLGHSPNIEAPEKLVNLLFEYL
jgi:pimeloyl-ACP methyl ester carboxylesterase